MSAVNYPARWAPALRDWLQHVPLNPAPHPFSRVFGLDFDETMLPRLCREGPHRGERGLPGDIKLVWDYSRGQPLFTNAAAGPAHVGACAAFLRRWLEANADTNGPAWPCAMELAIRATNWLFADALFDGELGKQLGEEIWAGSALASRLSHLAAVEALLVSSNNYLEDLLGLFVVGENIARRPPGAVLVPLRPQRIPARVAGADAPGRRTLQGPRCAITLT